MYWPVSVMTMTLSWFLAAPRIMLGPTDIDVLDGLLERDARLCATVCSNG